MQAENTLERFIDAQKSILLYLVGYLNTTNYYTDFTSLGMIVIQLLISGTQASSFPPDCGFALSRLAPLPEAFT